MKQILFIIYTAFLLFGFSGCDKQEEKMIDLDDMVMEDDDLQEEGKIADPIFSPQEIIVKEVPETQALEHQR